VAAMFYDRPLNSDIIQIIIAITTTTAIIPTTAPALKISPIRVQLLMVIIAIAINNKFNFFMINSLFD
jgi:hypothetical protein